MTLKSCVRYIRKELQRGEVKLILVKSDSVFLDDEPLDGYYDIQEKKLFVAINKFEEEWVSVLIHEYCHYKQWKRKTKAVRELELEHGDMIEIINLWVHRRIELTKEQQNKYVNGIKKMEKEADKMTVAFIRRHNLPIDIKIYRQNAKKALKTYDSLLKTRSF
jgi:hypothetical protein